MQDVKWHKVPEDQQEEWDELYRAIATQLIGHNVYHATAVLECEGRPLMISINLEFMPELAN